MTSLDIRPADECRYDAVSLGEVMLRLDPGEERIKAARSFRVWEGGGEYNVVRGLRRVFDQRAAVITAIGDNHVGLLLEDLILQGGVDTEYVVWKKADGIGRKHRNALNFTERAFAEPSAYLIVHIARQGPWIPLMWTGIVFSDTTASGGSTRAAYLQASLSPRPK